MMAAVSFEDVVREAGGVPHMSPREGRLVYDHIRSTGARDVLELGTAHGVGTSYLAAALEEAGEGKVTTVDRVFAGYEPGPAEMLERTGLAHRVDRVVVEDSSYAWWLKQRVEEDDLHRRTLFGSRVVTVGEQHVPEILPLLQR